VIRWPTYPYIAATGSGGLGEARSFRNTEAMVPEPNDDPKPDDEPDDETDDEPDDERDDEPGTLYFGRTTDGRPNPAEAHHHAPAARRSGHRGPGGCDFSTTRSMPHDCPGPGAAMGWGAESVSPGKPLP
jgi:hypothetical protein